KSAKVLPLTNSAAEAAARTNVAEVLLRFKLHKSESGWSQPLGGNTDSGWLSPRRGPPDAETLPPGLPTIQNTHLHIDRCRDPGRPPKKSKSLSAKSNPEPVAEPKRSIRRTWRWRHMRSSCWRFSSIKRFMHCLL